MKIADILKYEGGNNVFIWKHPLEDFNSTTQLIVHESQEAIFFMNGQALDLFTAGRYTLETQNIPLIGKHFKRATGDETPFHCEVYFINKVEQMAIKWGTDSKVEYLEPTYQFPIQIGASGEMNLRVEDSRKLLVKVIGTEDGIDQQSLVRNFRGIMVTKLKSYLANLITSKNINIFRIDEHLNEMSEAMHLQLIPVFSDYGIELSRFYISTIVKPEDDRMFQKFKEIHFRLYADVAEAEIRQKVGIIDQTTQTRRMVIEAEGISTKRKLEGYTYQDEKGFEVAEKVASNEAVGQMTNMGVGLGMMAGVGGTVGATVGGMMKNTMGEVLNPGVNNTASASVRCPGCGNILPGGTKFCSECGTKIISACPNCNTVVTPGVKFCSECGFKLYGGSGNE